MLRAHEYGIIEIAQKFGVSARTLLFYESQGLLCPKRTGNCRSYGVAEQVRIELIQTGKRLGFNLSEIAKLIHSATSDKSAGLAVSLARVSTQIVYLDEKRAEVDLTISELRRALKKLGA